MQRSPALSRGRPSALQVSHCGIGLRISRADPARLPEPDVNQAGDEIIATAIADSIRASYELQGDNQR
jgi:hypothetical protein